MGYRAAAWLAWSVWALCLALSILTVVLLLKTPPIRGGDEFDAPEALTALLRAMALAYPTVGAFIVSRRPTNPIGWILCLTGLLTGVRAFAAAYTYYGVAGRPDHLPGVEYAAWVGSWVGAPGVMLAAALLLLVFPDGRLIDRAWWAVVGMAACGAVLFALILALEQTQWIVIRSVDNPIEVSRSVIKEVVRPLGNLGLVLLLVSLVCGGVSLLIRVDKGSQVERQQIKWLALFAALMAVGFGFSNAGAWPFFLWACRILLLSYRRGHSRHALPPSGHRRGYKPHPRLRLAHRDTGGHLFRRGNGDPGSIPSAHRPRAATPTRRRGLYACYRGVVHPVEASHPIVDRPPFLPQEVRREEDPRSLLSPAA